MQERHIKLLEGLVLNHPEYPKTDFSRVEWQDARLVTPCHAVRIRWNESAIRKHCQLSGNQLFVCEAEDTIKGKPLDVREKDALANQVVERTQLKKKRQQLPVKAELAIGMKVMVTTNIETELDITNGVRGIIVDVILHPDEEYAKECEEVVTAKLPQYLLVKLDQTWTMPLESLRESVIPMEPMTQALQIQIAGREGKTI